MKEEIQSRQTASSVIFAFVHWKETEEGFQSDLSA